MYIREAHPVGGRLKPPDQFRITDPKTLEERRKVAQEFARQVKLSVPILVDTIDDQVEKAYAGWPDRLYVIDASGKVVLKAKPGPGGFMPAVKQAPEVLDKLLKGLKE
jgi:hypothetical protein